MSVDTTMAVLYAQTGLAAPFANAAAVAPQASLAMSRMLAAEMARQQQQQVEKTEKTAEKSNITPDRRGSHGQFGSRRRQRQAAAQEETDEASPSLASMVGCLLNVKV
ncbi:MAG: hypothetical protein IJA79_02350 [Desulfovibrio sp.]|nr:hypothetical protein [Desulfovibrio sp.]